MRGLLGSLVMASCIAGASGGSFWTAARGKRARDARADDDGYEAPRAAGALGSSRFNAAGRGGPRGRGVFRRADVAKFRECADELAVHPSGQLALMAIFLYLQNAAVDPADPERRLVSLLAPTFRACVGASARGLEAMQAAGFTSAHQAHDGTPYLFMPRLEAEDARALDAELRARLRLPDGAVPPSFAQAQLPSARIGDADELRSILADMRGAANASRAVRTMLGYVRAVQARPFDPRYRLVHCFNRPFLESVGGVPRGLDAMRALGFTGIFHAADGSGPFLVMPIVELGLLAEIEAELVRALPPERTPARPRAPASRAGAPAADGGAPAAAPDAARGSVGGRTAARPVRRQAARARANVQWRPSDAPPGAPDAPAPARSEWPPPPAVGSDEETEAAAHEDAAADAEAAAEEAEDEGLFDGLGPSSLGLPPVDLLLKGLLLHALEAISRLAATAAALGKQPPSAAAESGGPLGAGRGSGVAGFLPRFPGDNGTIASAAAFAAAALAAASVARAPPDAPPPPPRGAVGTPPGLGPPGLPGLPVPGLPLNFRLIFGKPPAGAIPLGTIDLPGGGGGGGLGGAAADGEGESEFTILEGKLQRARLSTEAREVAERELRRLKRMPPQHSDYSSTFDYLDQWLAELPWTSALAPRGGRAPQSVSISRASAALERSHCGLPKVKRRVLEYLAVAKLTREEARGTILCLLGPPGVGKTSLGQAVATSLGRKFARVSLGGVHSESEVRGHRRTYVGAAPGLIMQAIRKCGTDDPVIMLDELDKLSSRSLHGDPSAALLEALDPEQNAAFRDHFLNIPFNLSKVLFIATANEVAGISRPLYDRLEMIELAGYTTDEKVAIAREHLLPRLLQRHGLRPAELLLDDAVLELVAARYTREAGVRELERCLAALCRAIATEIAAELPDDADAPVDGPAPDPLKPAPAEPPPRERADGGADAIAADAAADGSPVSARRRRRRALAAANASAAAASADAPLPERAEPAPRPERASVRLTEARVVEILGAHKYDEEAAERLRVPGVAMGLAYTAVGGDVLFIEASKCAGSGKLLLTGRLGDVMKESATTALSWLRAHAFELGLVESAAADLLNRTDVHLHFPAGATPKDGPSAGVTIATALVSLLSGRLCRSDTAMTGELTLRGLVLPVGGIREKVVAAHRAGLRRVILPERNRKDLAELPANVTAAMSFTFARNVREVIEQVLLPPDVPGATGSRGELRPDDAARDQPPPAESPTLELPAVVPANDHGWSMPPAA